MAVFTEETVVSKTEVLELGQIQVQTEYRVLKDGVVIARSFSRHVLEPGDDLTNQHGKVAAIAKAVWTDEVRSKWNNMKAKRA